MNREATHVLIAEDDDDDYLIFSSVIEELKRAIQLSRVEDGIALIKFLEESIPDILFLDILMPCKDGRQCIREIRANKRFDTLPVITYSSLKTSETIDFFYREGANFYVVKPSSFPELKGVLEKLLSIDWKKALYYPAKAQFLVNPE